LPCIGDSVPFLPIFFRGAKPVPEWQINPLASVYQKRKRLGEETWLYSCTSAQALDYPNLFIDCGAQYQRIIPWVMYRYGFSGFLYWRVNYNFNENKNPWEDQYNIFAHGDGNLLYPGVPGLKGIEEHIPVPSLRLKLLREGFEDYEYLILYENISGGEKAQRMCAELVTTTLFWEHNSKKYHKARLLLGGQIEAVFKTQN